ncbi:hypothetical protein D3C81_1326780 [compost metagenome]
MATGGGQHRGRRARRRPRTFPGARPAQPGHRSQGQPAAGRAGQFPRPVPRPRAVHRRIGRPPRSAAGTARTPQAAPAHGRRLGRFHHRFRASGDHHRAARRWPAAGRPGARPDRREPAVRPARDAAPPSRQARRNRQRCRHQEPHRVARGRAGGAYRPWRWALPGPGHPGDRRPGGRIPHHGVRRGRQTVCAGGQPAPDRPLHRQR